MFVSVLMNWLIGYRLECRIMEKRDTETVGMHESADFSSKQKRYHLFVQDREYNSVATVESEFFPGKDLIPI